MLTFPKISRIVPNNSPRYYIFSMLMSNLYCLNIGVGVCFPMAPPLKAAVLYGGPVFMMG
jgi:hypothetical protein